ncbi:MAG: AAA family ATPase [Candidatus Aminicenantes bacterium]|nr:AAA family ATPase [Candidatus Aminicenantes bacterium]NIM82628.1 AAA family ATPase [Candidatus Aminicenantes bacterium]NIN21996.1 AAA family ATPase [Candidatus Aminicenantes bacterium]NIN45758.1 AAA family ATPase [Candidatus Aminicenantes bacterium]NIN88596.1 AAA family ATPase [Candidatus Aminicenantes bacterium]
MINTLLIRNFRLFKELKIEKLARVNLFVGKNNSGKSCLLEALRIYTAGADASVLSEIVSTREEDWNDTAAPGTIKKITQIDSPFRFLFHGYHLPEKPSGAIEIGPIDNEKQRIKIMPQFYQVTKDKDGRRLHVPIKNKSLNQLVDVEVGLELTEGDESRFLTYLFNLSSNIRISPANGPQNIQTVLPQNMDNEIIEKLWDNINITDLEDEVIRCLQLIDPNVRKIAFVGGIQRPDGKKPRIPIVRYADSEERIPLKNLGDGMTRLFQVILSLVNARNGYLFIDEFENGLHWSIHPHVWKIIFILSKRLNVQVFATTHNRDCIRGFHEVWTAREAEGAFHRLDLSDTKKVKPVNYTCEVLSDALETGVEVR